MAVAIGRVPRTASRPTMARLGMGGRPGVRPNRKTKGR